MWMQDSKELYKDHPVEIGTLFNILSIFGANVRTVEPKKQSNTPTYRNDPVFKELIEKGVEIPGVNPTQIEGIESTENGKPVLKKLSDFPDKIADFEKKKGEFLKEEIKSLKNGDKTIYVDRYGRVSTTNDNGDKEEITFKKLTDKQLKSLVSGAGGRATEKAKAAIFQQ